MTGINSDENAGSKKKKRELLVDFSSPAALHIVQYK